MKLTDEICPYCGQSIDFGKLYIESELLEIALAHNDIYYPETCCEEFGVDFMENRDAWAPDTWQRAAVAAASGNDVRSIIEDDQGRAHIDYCLTARLLTEKGSLKMAKEFVNKYHRHNRALPGWRFAI